MAELFDLMPAGPVLCAFMLYSIIFYSLLEGANDVISDKALELTGIDVLVMFNCSK